MDDRPNNKSTEDSKHIPGIYNYCDRWCERCAFTSRCLNFEMCEEKFGDADSLDINNAAFWNKLSEIFQETLTMLKDMAEEQGIDLDSISIEEQKRDRKRFNGDTVVHMITHMAKTYADMVDDCFETYVEVRENDDDDVNPGSGLHLLKPSAANATIPLEESLEVIQWYQHQIYVKLRRAISSAETENSMDLDDFPKDSDGSAKVALIGIDRSMSAWGNVVKYFPDLREKILAVIAHLKNLGKIVEKVFPDARAFVRPGFDDGCR